MSNPCPECEAELPDDLRCARCGKQWRRSTATVDVLEEWPRDEDGVPEGWPNRHDVLRELSHEARTAKLAYHRSLAKAAHTALIASEARERGMREALISARTFVANLGVPQDTAQVGLQIFQAGKVMEGIDAALASPAVAAPTVKQSLQVAPPDAASVPESPDGWVSVKERMPDHHKLVLFHVEGRDAPDRGFYSAAGDQPEWFDGEQDVIAFRVKWWQPLPPLPPAGEGK